MKPAKKVGDEIFKIVANAVADQTLWMVQRVVANQIITHMAPIARAQVAVSNVVYTRLWEDRYTSLGG